MPNDIMATEAPMKRFWRIKVKVVRHLIIFCCCFAFTLLVRATLRQSYIFEQERIDQEGRNRRSGELAANWRRLKYMDVSSPDFENQFLAVTNWATLNSLSGLQKKQFFQRFAETISYLGEPTFDKFFKLKTHDLRTRFELSPGARQVLSSRRDPATRVLSLPASEVTGMIWRALEERDGLTEPLPHITAINLERLKAATSRSNTAASVFSGATAQGMTMLRGAVDAGFRYGTLATNQNWPADGTAVLVSFLAKSSNSTNSGPVYLSFYWSDGDHEWAPQQLVSDVMLNIDPLF
jgi:hypothetical protein